MTRILAIPPLTALLMLSVYVGVEAVRPGTLTAPRPATISEAIVVGNGPRALEMIAEGLDVNASAGVRPGMFGAAAYDVTPLEAALLSQRIEIVRLLMRTGADPARSARAACLASAQLPEALSIVGLSPVPVPGGFSGCFTVSGRQGALIHGSVRARRPHTSS